MIDITKLTPLNNSKLTTILDNFQNLTDNSTIYTGTNILGNRVVGFLIGDKENHKQTLHAIVSPKDYFKFIMREESCYHLLQKSYALYLMEQNFDNLKSYIITFEQIHKYHTFDIENSTPTITDCSSYIYTITLLGKKAFDNKISIPEINIIQTNLRKIFNLFSTILEKNGPKNSCKIDIDLYAPSENIYYSNGITFHFKISPPYILDNKNHKNLFVDPKSLTKLLNHYLKFIFNKFHKNFTPFIEYNTPSMDYQKIVSHFNDIIVLTGNKNYNLSNYIGKKLLKMVKNIHNITKILGNNFDSLSIKNGNKTIAILDQKYKKEITKMVPKLHRDLYKDEAYKIYQITIHQLNVNTRKGRGHVVLNKVVSRPKIEINRKLSLENSKYIESLNTQKPISVLAKAIKRGNKILELQILFEEV